MSASTVTGRGLGASFGKYKPENNCGGCTCGCGNKECNEPTSPPHRIGCYTRVKTGNKVSYASVNLSPGVRVCS